MQRFSQIICKSIFTIGMLSFTLTGCEALQGLQSTESGVVGSGGTQSPGQQPAGQLTPEQQTPGTRAPQNGSQANPVSQGPGQNNQNNSILVEANAIVEGSRTDDPVLVEIAETAIKVRKLLESTNSGAIPRETLHCKIGDGVRSNGFPFIYTIDFSSFSTGRSRHVIGYIDSEEVNPWCRSNSSNCKFKSTSDGNRAKDMGDVLAAALFPNTKTYVTRVGAFGLGTLSGGFSGGSGGGRSSLTLSALIGEGDIRCSTQHNGSGSERLRISRSDIGNLIFMIAHLGGLIQDKYNDGLRYPN